MRKGRSGPKSWRSVAVLVAGLFAVGCLQAATPSGTDPENLGPDSAVVHRAGAVEVAPATWPGETPDMVLRAVGAGVGYEPTVAVTSDGTAFYATYSDPGFGLPVSLSQVHILRSGDLGETWEDVSPRILGRDYIPLAWDPILYVDPVTDRLFFSYTNAVCMGVHWTDDLGRTWEASQAVCALPVNDHDTLFTGPPVGVTTRGYPSVVYLCSNQVRTETCLRSLDGGATWELPGSPVLAPYSDGSGGPACAQEWWLQGHGFASPAEDGTAYVPFSICGHPHVMRSPDNGVSWELVEVAPPGQATPHHEARVAVDSQGNAYFFWLGADFLPRVAISRDHGVTWGDAIPVGVPEVTVAVGHYVAIVAGDPGRIAFLYLGARVEGGPDADEEAMAQVPWYAYVGFSIDALSDDPTFATTLAHERDDPIHRGPCDGDLCGTGSANGMAHYIGLSMDPASGRVWAALVDTCNEGCTGANGTIQPDGRNRAVVGVQVAGHGLREGAPPWHAGS